MHQPSPDDPRYEADDEQASRPVPPKARDVPITSLLIAANILIFALEELWGGSESMATLLRMGAIDPRTLRHLYGASLISYGYLHIGAIHLGMNMYALWNTGRLLEPLLGRSRFFLLYTFSLVGGGVAISLSKSPHVTAGASGALFGLMGAICALLYRRYRNSQEPEEKRAIRSMLSGLLLPNLVISLLPGVSLLGHAGGLIIGALFVARIFLSPENMRRSLQPARPSRGRSAAAIALLVLTVAAIGWVWLTLQPWRPLEQLSAAPRAHLGGGVASASK